MPRARTSAGRPVGIGVIGARSMVATRAVLPAIDAASTTHVAAVAAHGGPVPRRWADAAVDTYDDVLDHADVDAVYVPLPNALHREWVERAAAAGLHVLCEKPLAASAADARAMVSACRQAGVLLAEAWMTPFDPRWREAARRVRRGTIGELRAIDATFTFTIPSEAATNYRWDPDLGGGALLDVGIYCLGPVADMWGTEPRSVDVSSLPSDRGVDATTVAELRWDDGRVARARCSFVEPEVQRLEYVGSQGRIALEGDAHTGGTAARSFALDHTGTAPQIIDVQADDPYRLMIERFAAALRDEADWPRPAERAVDLLELLERIRDAALASGATTP